MRGVKALQKEIIGSPRDWYAFVTTKTKTKTKKKPNGLLPETWANPFYYYKLVVDFRREPNMISLRIHFGSLLFPLFRGGGG